MRVQLLKDCEGPAGKLPAGTIIDDKRAHALVELGIAEPLDDAAREVAALHGVRRRVEDEERRKRRKLEEDQAAALRRQQFARELGIELSDVEAGLAKAKQAEQTPNAERGTRNAKK